MNGRHGLDDEKKKVEGKVYEHPRSSAQIRSTAEHEVGRRGRLRPVLTERSTIHLTAETAGSTI